MIHDLQELQKSTRSANVAFRKSIRIYDIKSIDVTHLASISVHNFYSGIGNTKILFNQRFMRLVANATICQ